MAPLILETLLYVAERFGLTVIMCGEFFQTGAVVTGRLRTLGVMPQFVFDTQLWQEIDGQGRLHYTEMKQNMRVSEEHARRLERVSMILVCDEGYDAEVPCRCSVCSFAQDGVSASVL
jgi:hypothetical protein